ncbi:hypothetical protein [Ruminococcus callidus]|uniref:hypothetical protein n=1 Tax=Ruminococcus callidus TaxID=40519 RepID=UPI0023F065AA|nr:hypothetical protein [Ruminococcus callidus]
MNRKAFTLTLAAFLLVSLAACSSNETNSSKTANETTSAVETSVSEKVHSDIIRICQDFLQNNETDETLASIIDIDTPDVQEMKDPPSEDIYAALAEEPGTGPYYAVTFSTTEDSLLGPIILYVNQEKEVFGIGYRE